VTNSGTGAVLAGEAGKLTVVDALPLDMSVSLMSGLGWICASTTCERQEGLAANGSYPPITGVGGGEVNTANDTAIL
jgi:hypothetical protein